VNGVDASSLDDATWARLVALAPQEGRLVRGTVAENIAFFRSGVDADHVRRAAEAVHLQPDLARWPAGIDTQVGSRGEAISGGQAQRINLARAIAARPDLLVLDEPTSAVDTETELAIVDTLRAMKGHITVIVIAHRQSTISMCDRVLEVRDGIVVDRPASRV
jgi:ABC-type multidrug transport system fused ATPase/permease subunit